MEKECAMQLRTRSVKDHELRYTTMFSDSDCKAFDSLVGAKVYGDSIQIFREDCINHVSKRMGTALRNLISASKGQRRAFTGKGKLTAVKPTKIPNYHGRAIND